MAHALEMDLMGYGKTEKAAVNELCSLIESQITFARHKGDDGLLSFPAEKEFFDRWEAAHTAALKREVLQDNIAELNVKAICISLDQTLSKLPKGRFEPVELSHA